MGCAGTPPEKLIGAAFDALLVEYDGEASGPAAERSLAEALRSQLMPVCACVRVRVCACVCVCGESTCQPGCFV